MVTGQPVPSFGMKYEWHEGDWERLFDAQVDYIQMELKRALAEDRMIVYLSCPISGRGGGDHRTNVDIANYTARKLMMDWGTNFFILNPCQFQMESKEGTGLIRMHAENADPKIDVDQLQQQLADNDDYLRGGDYMRMWTRVLVEDHYLKDEARKGRNLGGMFDGFYFLGPSDVREFFTKGGSVTATAGVEEYFARKYAMDPDFRAHFDLEDLEEGEGKQLSEEERKRLRKEEWERLRKDFFRFYTLRASANFSKGCHDEWNIWVRLNEKRLAHKKYGLGARIAGFFDGRQIEPASSERGVSRGYELKKT